MAITLQEGNNELNVQLVPVAAPVANLYGVVTDAQTGYPIEGVRVEIAGVFIYTDSSGNYGFIGLTPGSYTITFSKAGYTTLTR